MLRFSGGLLACALCAGACEGRNTTDSHYGGTSGGDGGAVYRPFSANSPWNTKIASNPTIAVDSAALVTDLATSSQYGTHLDVNIAGYSIPFYWADASTPRVQVLADIGGEGWTGSNGFNATASMPIPAGAMADPQSDHHILVVDRAANMEWGCWAMNDGSGGYHAGLCATADLAGTGVRPIAATANPWYVAHGARACGYPLIAGLIRPEEIEAGRIDHALVIAYPHIRSRYYTPPASTAQATTTDAISTRGIPCGGRIQFDPDVSLASLGLSAAGVTIMRALQEYGAYVGDYSGAISLYADNSPDARAYWATGTLDTYAMMNKVEFADFRVLELGTLYDNNN